MRVRVPDHHCSLERDRAMLVPMNEHHEGNRQRHRDDACAPNLDLLATSHAHAATIMGRYTRQWFLRQNPFDDGTANSASAGCSPASSLITLSLFLPSEF